jgi:hypothetical protein
MDHRAGHHEVNRGPGDYGEFDVFNKCQIVWLHGKAEQYSDKNSRGEIGSLDDSLIQLLRPLLRASPIVVLGYRGAEPSIMGGLFGQSDAGRLDFRNGIYWCIRSGEDAHSKVLELARRLSLNFTFVEIYRALARAVAHRLDISIGPEATLLRRHWQLTPSWILE